MPSAIWPQTPVRKSGSGMPAGKLAAIPDFVLPAKYKDRTAYPLPAAVDNSLHPFFPPYKWSIQGYSCSNATAVSYLYDYEVKFANNITAPAALPMFTYEYTYHFLNGGDQAEGGDGWMFVDAFDILKETGGATSTDFGGFEYGNFFGGWMSGYDKYYNAMKNRLSDYYKIDALEASSDELIKQYLHDHADGSPVGGLLTFRVNSDEFESEMVLGRRTVTSVGGPTNVGHSMAIVGYDDNFNGGCYLLANNWGDGFHWIPYKMFHKGGALATAVEGNPVMFARPRKNYAPKLALKVTLTHNQRNAIAIMTGMAPASAATAPVRTKDYAGAFNYSGGAFPMLGKNQGATIEIGLDLTDFAPHITGGEARFFLQVVSKGGTGAINKVTLMDYTGGQVKEIAATETEKTISPNGTTLVSIPWSGSITSVKELPALKASLSGSCFAAPNPAFRADGPVRIRFSGAGAALARLTVRDSKGRPVHFGEMALDASRNTRASAIPASMAWTLEDSRGDRVAPGQYFASLELWNGRSLVRTESTRIRVFD